MLFMRLEWQMQELYFRKGESNEPDKELQFEDKKARP